MSSNNYISPKLLSTEDPSNSYPVYDHHYKDIFDVPRSSIHQTMPGIMSASPPPSTDTSFMKPFNYFGYPSLSTLNSGFDVTPQQSTAIPPLSILTPVGSRQNSIAPTLNLMSPSTSPASSPGGSTTVSNKKHEPVIVEKDSSGIEWISINYTIKRVTKQYRIRCDIETVDFVNLSPEFKRENCVYARAMVPVDEYTGNRFHYETECNFIAWGLTFLNPKIRGTKGLIQRAVDSWRNTNANPRFRSRRVKRLDKKTNSELSESVLQWPGM